MEYTQVSTLGKFMFISMAWKGPPGKIPSLSAPDTNAKDTWPKEEQPLSSGPKMVRTHS